MTVSPGPERFLQALDDRIVEFLHRLGVLDAEGVNPAALDGKTVFTPDRGPGMLFLTSL